jgi:hypothetical protein
LSDNVVSLTLRANTGVCAAHIFLIMVKSFLGVDLKTGGKIILAICLIENLIIYTIVAMRSNLKVNDYYNEFMEVPVVNAKIGRDNNHFN